MTISEKILHSSPFEVKLYLEGVFWVAYEQSAYWFMQKKSYKTTRKHIKLLGRDIVCLGFPKSVLEDFLKTEQAISSHTTDDKYCVISLKEPLDMVLFEEWKSGLPQHKSDRGVAVLPQDTAGQTLVERLKAFSIADSTPVECMIFLSEIKRLL
jgi:hypothetical protein